MRVEVVQSPGGIGKTVQTFTSQNDYPVWVASNPYLSAQQRFAPWAYGLPDSTMVYDVNGKLIKEVKNIYNFGLAKHLFASVVTPGVIANPNLTSCKCEVTHSTSLNSSSWSGQGANNYTLNSNGNMNVVSYGTYTGRVELDTTVERVYSTVTAGQYVETKTAYTYNSMADTSYFTMTSANNYDVRQITSWQSNGDTMYKTVSYPGDYYPVTTLNTGLTAHWPLNNTGNDISGNNFNGTVANVTPTADRFGVANNAFLFNGTNSSITIADATALHLNNTDYSITAWVRLDAYNTGLSSAIVSRRGSTGSGQGYILSVSGINSINSGGYGATTGGNIAYGNGYGGYGFSSSPIGLGGWHLITATYSLSNQTVSEYLDGVLYNTYSGVVTTPTTSNPLTIGFDEAAVLSNSGGYYFQGAMSDIRLYNRALAKQEVQQLFNPTGISGPANPQSGPLYTLYQNNIASIPVESYTWEKKASGQGTKYLSEKVTEFLQISNGDIKPSRELEQRFAQPAASMTIYQGPANTANPAYKQVQTYSYGSTGTVVGQRDEGGHIVTSIYDYNDKYKVATVVNADPVLDSSAYTSFETPSFGGWKLTGTAAYVASTAVTGTEALALGSANTLTAPLNTVTPKPYILSFWATNSSMSVSGGTLVKSAPVINGFTYYEYNIAQGPAKVTLTGTATIDELRLYPQAARMRTTTYDPLAGKTSECDENNRITYYQYDNLGRLRFVEDENKNVLKMYEYNNVSSIKQTGCPATFYSPLIAESFHRTNCGVGYYGDTATYIIPANKYSSTISQADADAKAEVDLLLNGPVFGNSNGACRIIYYNTVHSETDSSLICTGGKQGKWITYTVPAGKYSSVVSQAAADSLAQDDIAANAQANANILADSSTYCTVSTTPDWESSETNPVYYCSAGNEYIQETDINPNSPTFNQIQYDSVGVGDGACSSCAFIWDASITNTINSNVSFSGNNGSFNFVFFPPSVGYTGGTIGQLKGGCVPTSIQSVIVSDGASNNTRTWLVTFYPTGIVTIQLYSGPAPTSTTAVPISINSSFSLGSSLNIGLIARWQLNNTGTDVSGNSHNGTLSNTTATTDHHGVANNALLFNGTNSLVTISDAQDLRLNNSDYSISAWVRLDAYNSGLNSAVLSRRGSTGANQGYLLFVSGVNSINTGGLGATTGGKFGFNNGSASYSWSSTPAGLSQWHLITEVYSLANQTIREYYDGVLYNTYTGVATPPNTSYPLTIGFDQAASISNSGGYYFQGAMSDVRIYNRDLSTAEIQQLYTQ